MPEMSSGAHRHRRQQQRHVFGEQRINVSAAEELHRTLHHYVEYQHCDKKREADKCGCTSKAQERPFDVIHAGLVSFEASLFSRVMPIIAATNRSGVLEAPESIATHAAFVEKVHTICKFEQLFVLAGGDNHGHAIVGTLPQDFVNLTAGVDVHALGGIIEQQQIGVHRDPPGNDQFLLITAGE